MYNSYTLKILTYLVIQTAIDVEANGVSQLPRRHRKVPLGASAKRVPPLPTDPPPPRSMIDARRSLDPQ